MSRVAGAAAPPRGRGGLLATALAGGLVAGVALDVLTWAVARYGPQAPDGQPWSLRGNGALIVPLGVGPAVLAGAWAGLVLRCRWAPRWQALGIGAGLVGAAFVLAGVLVLVVFGSAAQRVSDWLSVAPLGWMVVAPLLASLLPLARRRTGGLPLSHVAAGVIFAVALVAGFFGAGIVLAPGT